MNINIRWHDLYVTRLTDGGIHLEQSPGVEEPSVIHLHPEQLLSIARQLCGMKPEDAGRLAELERRIAILTDKLQSIVCNRLFRTDLLDAGQDGYAHLVQLDGLLDLALEFDGGRLTPEVNDDAMLEPGIASQLAAPCAAMDQAKKTQPSAIAEGGEKLGLAV